MRVDAHQHFWYFHPERDTWITEEMGPIRRDFLPEDLRPQLEALGFDGCIAVQADQSLEETDFLLDLARTCDFVLGVVGWVDLRSAALASQLEKYGAEPLLKGVRHIVQAEPDDRFLMREDFLRGIGQIKAYDLTYDVLVYPHQLPAAIDFAAQFPDQLMVLDHLAKPYIKARKFQPWADHVRQLAEHPQVYCKLSGMVTEADWQHWQAADFLPYMETVLEAFGAGRLMIGSDWPVCLLGGAYQKVMGLAMDFVGTLSETEQAAILGENARTFYGLTDLPAQA